MAQIKTVSGNNQYLQTETSASKLKLMRNGLISISFPKATLKYLRDSSTFLHVTNFFLPGVINLLGEILYKTPPMR